MSYVSNKIIDYLVRNRISTTEVADCLGKSGALNEIYAINKGHYIAGQIKWVYAYNESNWDFHRQICDIKEGRIIFVESFNCGNRAIFGELVSKYLLLYRQCKGIIVDGNLRDASALIKENYPIWCKGYNPEGCFNREPSESFDNSIYTKHKEKYDDAIAVCDDCGVVIIPKKYINKEFLFKLEDIENQEDIWFERLDQYKENTFEIVCQKNYLKDELYMKGRKNMEE